MLNVVAQWNADAYKIRKYNDIQRSVSTIKDAQTYISKKSRLPKLSARYQRLLFHRIFAAGNKQYYQDKRGRQYVPLISLFLI